MASRKARPNARFYIVIAAVVLVAAIVAVLLLRTTGGEIENATVEMEADVTAVVIRDETVTTAESYGKITYYVAEGERITSGTKIAEVYKWGTYDSVLQDLLTIQQEIRNYQVGTVLADVVNSELTSIEYSIDAKLGEIAAVVRGESDADALVLEQELKTLMDSSRDYLKANLQPDDKLMTLYSREQTMLSRLESWKQDVYSQSAGMISFFFDGYEAVLNRTTMGQVKASDISAVIKGSSLGTSASAEKPLYRVANTQRWYLAVLTDSKSEAQFVPGETYSVVFDGNYDKPYTAECESQTVEKDTTINILRVDDDVAPVMNARTISATVQASYTGLTVNANAIVTENGQKGIRVTTGSDVSFVPVTVLCSSGGKAAIRPLDGYTLSEGMNYSAG